ncbi:MAG: hypothetical protein OXN86_12485 [Chloroflexota bacterium]|nr:hypothetical protein [Chloroflexota bacterium]
MIKVNCYHIVFRSVGAAALIAFAALTAVFVGNWIALSPPSTVEAEDTEEATVRISAKRLANELTEFGLQVYSEGEWAADRTLPRLRSLSPNADVNRWYRSSSIELDSGHLVRIVARLLETGQFEVGLHEIVDGQDSERRIPQTRLFPRSPTVDQWLNTSALVLANPDPGPPHTPLVGTSGWVGLDIEYTSWYNNDGVHTWVRSGTSVSKVVDAEEEALPRSLYLTQACGNSQERTLRIEGLSGSDEPITVMSDQDPNTVEIDLATDEDDAETQYWRLYSVGGQSWLSADEHASNLLVRLREASTATVTIIGSGLTPATFNVDGMFDTPVQGNIDNCGNYIEPTWQPITQAQSGGLTPGVYYRVDYPQWLGGERRTYVTLDASGERTGADGSHVDLTVDCRRGDRSIQIGFLPSGIGEYAVRSRIDEAGWTQATWIIMSLGSDQTYTNPPLDYEDLRTGTTLQVEIPLIPTLGLSFDLAALFSTPVQANIDNCGVPEWPEPESTQVANDDVGG